MRFLLHTISFAFVLTFCSTVVYPKNTATGKHKKHHHPYNRCPIKRGKDKKLIKGYYYGVASFYHSKFNGRKTTNGERFSSKKMTCAHKSLRLGSYVEITNLANHRKIYVKVNDRLPPNSCRMVDLTRLAAIKLKMVHQGLAKVKMRVIPRSIGMAKVQEEMESFVINSSKKSHLIRNTP
jgi:rare lipoprotein A (peptidoglycan hydrolase)